MRAIATNYAEEHPIFLFHRFFETNLVKIVDDPSAVGQYTDWNLSVTSKKREESFLEEGNYVKRKKAPKQMIN